MIYRYYKGGLYYLEGHVTKNPTVLDSYYKKESIIKAKYEKTLEEVGVVLVHDMSWNMSFYMYENEGIDGVMALYRDIHNQYWLRLKKDFHGDVEISDAGETYMSPRFEKVDGEYLFETIIDLMS